MKSYCHLASVRNMRSVIIKASKLGAVLLKKDILFSVKSIRTFSVCRSHHLAPEHGDHTLEGNATKSNAPSPDPYDIVISGGGMVGTAMACALGHEQILQDKRILLLEGGPEKSFDTLPEKYANRVSALSLATKELLSNFGAWEHICNMRYQPVKRMQVWDACSDSMIGFNHPDMTNDLAYLVENDVTLAAIYKQLQKLNNCVEIRYQTKVESIALPSSTSLLTTENPWAQVCLENGEKINTRLLIGADGFNSLVKKTSKIHSFSLEYKQMGVVATLHLSEATENNVAWQRFLPTGPVAILPLSDTRSSLVWTTTREHAKDLVRLPADRFVDAVNEALWTEDKKDGTAVYAGQLLEKVISNLKPDSASMRQLPPSIVDIDDGSRAAFPLGLSHADHYCRPRVALIGDAAHRVHPLAGQGVNLGFGDVACLKNKLCEAVYNGNDIGSISHLLDYETERQRHIMPILAAVDGLNRLYSTDWAPLVLLRSLGLQATNALTPVKDFLKSQATLG